MANVDPPVNFSVSKLFSTVLSPVSKVFKPTLISNFNPPACFKFPYDPEHNFRPEHMTLCL